MKRVINQRAEGFPHKEAAEPHSIALIGISLTSEMNFSEGFGADSFHGGPPLAHIRQREAIYFGFRQALNAFSQR